MKPESDDLDAFFFVWFPYSQDFFLVLSNLNLDSMLFVDMKNVNEGVLIFGIRENYSMVTKILFRASLLI